MGRNSTRFDSFDRPDNVGQYPCQSYNTILSHNDRFTDGLTRLTRFFCPYHHDPGLDILILEFQLKCSRLKRKNLSTFRRSERP
jgi:hypothetical protein